jgi:hypothetical protein
MLDVCNDIANSLNIEFNANKWLCLVVGCLSELNLQPMILGEASIHWVTSLMYLVVTIKAGRVLLFNGYVVKQSFFTACNCVHAQAKDMV